MSARMKRKGKWDFRSSEHWEHAHSSLVEGISSKRKQSVTLIALNINFPFIFEPVGPEHPAIQLFQIAELKLFGLDVLIAAFFSVAGATRQQPLGALTATFDGC